MLVVLLGVGALVIDVGALYAERRQLQNGADAAALAVAADCAEGDCLDETAHRRDVRRRERQRRRRQRRRGVRLRARPGRPARRPPPGTAGATGWVQVTTSTHNPANSNPTQVKFVLAPVLDAANVGGTVARLGGRRLGTRRRGDHASRSRSRCASSSTSAARSTASTFPDQARTTSTSHETGPDGLHTDCRGQPLGAEPSRWLRLAGLRRTARPPSTSAAGSAATPGTICPSDCDLTTWQNAEVLIPSTTRHDTHGSRQQRRVPHRRASSDSRCSVTSSATTDLEHAWNTASARTRRVTAVAASTASSPG